MAEPRKILLGEDELPSAWFNIVPSMPTKPDPYLHPQTREPVGPDALALLFPMALIGQEVSTDEWVDIPGPVLDVYKLWRPTPPIRALDLERPSIPRPASTTSMRAGRRPAPTSPTPPSPRRSTTRRRASPGSAPRPGRPVGQRSPSPAPASAWSARSHGPRLLRRQAVPALAHGDLGGERQPVAVAGDQRRPGRARPGPGLARVAGHRHLRGGRGRRPPRGHPLLAGQRAQPCAAPPDRHRPRAEDAARAGRGRARRAGRLRRRRVQLRRLHLPAAGREARRPPTPGWSRSSRPPPRPSPRAGSTTTSATRPAWPH